MAGAARRESLVASAAETFAEAGFGVTTREIARRAGVTQALLYKHFPSKAEIVEEVLAARFLGPREGPDQALLAGAEPLADRLGRFYGDFVLRGTPVGLRLFLRAALDGLDLPRRFAGRLDERMLAPVLGALRREAGLPPLPEATCPLPAEEREVAMMLHGGIVFTLIRREIYRIDFPLPHAALVALHARVFAPGAVAEIARIAGGYTDPSP
jgi:AcrR family transcriptional regulator